MVCPHCELAYPSGTTSCSRCGRELSSPDQEATVIFDNSETSAAASKPPPPPAVASGVITPPPAGESQIKTAVRFSGAFSLTLQPGTDFGPRYRIESLLGEGGMGSVYKATDKELGRTVALKLVRPEFAAIPAAMARFRQELLLASKISHKNVLRIHDLGDAGGIKFITMAYVDGRDLGKLLESGRLPLERVLPIARQLCSALDAAHSEGVVHRDLKPNNILMDESGNVYVMDFGLAKSLEAEATMMTRTGQILGTPRYMAPEQVEAKTVDHRADIYALGLILYEMVSGEIPFHADSAMQLMYQRVTQKPKDLKQANPDAPDYLARIIMRCLEKDPDARYQNAREILKDLETEHAPDRTISITLPRPKAVNWKWVAAGLVVVVLGLGGLMVLPRLQNRSAPASGATASASVKYIAVLKFKVSGDANAQYLADGLVEALSAKLLGLRNVYVASPSMVDKVSAADPLDKIGRSLGVRLVVRGTLDVNGDNLKVQATLDDVPSRKRVWSQDFTGLRQDVLSVEDQIYSKLVSALNVKPSNEELARATSTRPTEDVAAYELYLKARNSGGQGDLKRVTEVLNLYDQATKKDPQFALAYAGLADAATHMYDLTKDSFWTEKALGAARQAQRLNDVLPEVHFSLGNIYTKTGRTVEALAELKRALELAPNSDEASRRLGAAYLAAGRPADAVQALERAVAVNPYYYMNYNGLGTAYLQAGNNSKAAEAFLQVTKLEPDYGAGYLNLGLVYFRQGKTEECIPLLQRALQLQPSYFAYENLGVAFFYLGNFSEAVRMFEQAVALNPNQQVAVGNLADAYRWAGQTDKSKTTYQRAIGLAFKAFQVNPRDAKTLGSLSVYYAKTGDDSRALQFIRRARSIDASDASLMYKEGVIHALAGRKTEALESLRSAFQKNYSVEEAKHDPELASLREDPAFQKLLAAFGLSTRR